MNLENYEKFLESVDSDLKKIFDYQREYLACKEGCAHCCKRGDYPMSELEFEYLMLGFEKLSEELKAKIKENIKIAKSSSRESYICPFLINDSCSVYQYRPFVCRAFGVLTEDSKGNPAYPFCTTLGLNFSGIYDAEKQQLSSELVAKKGYKIFPKIFRLSNNVIMQLPLAKQLNLDFGKAKIMVDFF